MVIEYAKQDGDITRDSATGGTTGGRTGVPLLRFYEKQSPRDGDKHILDDHQMNSNVESLSAELLEHLSSVGKPLQLQRDGSILTKRSEHSQQAHQI